MVEGATVLVLGIAAMVSGLVLFALGLYLMIYSTGEACSLYCTATAHPFAEVGEDIFITSLPTIGAGFVLTMVSTLLD